MGVNVPARMRPVSEEDRIQAREVFSGPFLHGLCAAFAVAASRRTGWLMAAVRDRATGAMLHVGLDAPGGRYLDVRGYHESQEDFCWLYGGSVSWADEGTVLDENPHVTEEKVEWADGLLDLITEDLPGRAARIDRLEGFARDLEAACRRHGVWLRSDGPHGIVVYDAYGDEGRYEFSLGPTGEARLHRGGPVRP